VIDDPDLRAQPFAPTVRTDPRLDVLTERARKSYLAGSLALVPTARAPNQSHPLMLSALLGGKVTPDVRLGAGCQLRSHRRPALRSGAYRKTARPSTAESATGPNVRLSVLSSGRSPSNVQTPPLTRATRFRRVAREDDLPHPRRASQGRDDDPVTVAESGFHAAAGDRDPPEQLLRPGLRPPLASGWRSARRPSSTRRRSCRSCRGASWPPRCRATPSPWSIVSRPSSRAR